MKRIQLLMLAIMIGALAVFGGCNSDTGEICSLEKAYEQGLLDQEAMQSIADYWNSNTICPEELSYGERGRRIDGRINIRIQCCAETAQKCFCSYGI